MAATIQKIAELADVSRGTVDRVINQRGKVNAAVEQKIWAIAKEIGYIHKPRKKRCSYTIGVITQLCDASFMFDVHKGIEKARDQLEAKNVTLLLRESKAIDEKEQLHYIDELVEEGIDALAIMPVDCEAIRVKINEVMEARNIPVVTFNSDIIGTNRNCFIGMDNKQSGKAAAGLLGLLCNGKGNVLIITGYFTNRANSLRVEGFIEELQISFPEMVLLGVQSSQDKTAMVEQIVLQTLQTYQDVDAIFLASAGQQGVYQAFQKLNIEKRPYIIAYDITEHNKKCLLRGDFDFLMDQESEQQGYAATMILYDILQGKDIPGDCVYTNIQLKTRYTLHEV